MKSQEHLDLPWLINNTLNAEQQQQIKNRVAENSELQTESAFLQHLRQHIKTPTSHSPGELGWQRLQRDIKNQKNHSPRRMALAIAASVLLLVQGSVIISLLQTTTPEATYVPLGATPAADLQIRFKPGTSEIQMRELLLQMDAQIIEGPSASGLYHLALEDKKLLDKTLLQAQQNTLVEFVARELAR